MEWNLGMVDKKRENEVWVAVKKLKNKKVVKLDGVGNVLGGLDIA